MKIANFEWIIIELLVLGVVVWELVKTRRMLRRSRAEQAARRQEPPSA